ncbi:MAG: MBL fold metallo-hydrolase [Pseudomonadota bacterium]
MIHFRQLRDEATGAYSYLLGCPETGRALVIDPVVNQTPLYLSLLGELNLRLEWAIETHLHADHISAADSLREWTGAKIVVGSGSGIRNADHLLTDGEHLACGGLELLALATPGHTPGCFSYYWCGRLFTGDCLLIGSCGRTDEPGSDSAQLYDSVVRRLFSYPDETLVYPGHCLSGRRVSSIGEERESNPHFHGVSRDSFVSLKNDDGLPGVLPIALEANRHCGRLIRAMAA